MNGPAAGARREARLHLAVDAMIAEPALQCLAGCMRELAPAISRSVARHGHGTTLAALITLAANRAIDGGTGGLVASAFRDGAAMLEAHARPARSGPGRTHRDPVAATATRRKRP